MNSDFKVEKAEELPGMGDQAGETFPIEDTKSDTEVDEKELSDYKPPSDSPQVHGFEAYLAAGIKFKGSLSSDKEELWALEELEKEEDLIDEFDRNPHTIFTDEEEDEISLKKKGSEKRYVNVLPKITNSPTQGSSQFEVTNANQGAGSMDEDISIDENNRVPTIYFSHSAQPKRVRINTGKNITYKFSEKKEGSKRKRKNICISCTPDLPNIKAPTDIYKAFVDVVNGEYVPRKSILKPPKGKISNTGVSTAIGINEQGRALESGSYKGDICSTSKDSRKGEKQEQENPPKEDLPSAELSEMNEEVPCPVIAFSMQLDQKEGSEKK